MMIINDGVYLLNLICTSQGHKMITVPGNNVRQCYLKRDNEQQGLVIQLCPVRLKSHKLLQ